MTTFLDEPLTPSELVFMNGEKFAPQSGNLRVRLLHVDLEVSSFHLALAVMAAAVLVNEKLGALHLDLVEHKSIFSQNKTFGLVIKQEKNLFGWQSDTLEAMIPDWTRRVREAELSKILENIIAEDCKDPLLKIIDTVAWGMAASGWLMHVEGEAAKAFTTEFVCPARIRELAVQQSLLPVQQLFIDCREKRPVIWNQLQEELKRAVVARTISKGKK
jgi:hypothetical protein